MISLSLVAVRRQLIECIGRLDSINTRRIVIGRTCSKTCLRCFILEIYRAEKENLRLAKIGLSLRRIITILVRTVKIRYKFTTLCR